MRLKRTTASRCIFLSASAECPCACRVHVKPLISGLRPYSHAETDRQLHSRLYTEARPARAVSRCSPPPSLCRILDAFSVPTSLLYGSRKSFSTLGASVLLARHNIRPSVTLVDCDHVEQRKLETAHARQD